MSIWHVCAPVHPSVYLYVCTSIGYIFTAIHLSVCPLGHLGNICVSVSTAICSPDKQLPAYTLDLQVQCWLLIPSPFILFLGTRACLSMGIIIVAAFLCIFSIMSQDNLPSTTPTVTVLISGTSSMTTLLMMTPAMVGLPAGFGQQNGVLLPPLISRDTRCVVGLTAVPQQLHFQGYANYAMGPPQVSFFSESSFPPICLDMLAAYYCVYFLLPGSHADAFSPTGLNC